jgi:hypothetical protein
MAQDENGNALSVGSNLWIPATVTGVLDSGIVVVQTAYGSASIAIQGPYTHIDPGELGKPSQFPDLPGGVE